MKWWKNLGTSSGAMLLKPLRDEWSYWRNWLMENHPRTYEEVNNKTSPTQGMLNAVYRFISVPTKEYTHSHKRGVFIFSLYENAVDFLCDRVTEKELLPISTEWVDWWLKKSMDRYEKLKVEERVSNETLFHENIDLDELQMWASVRGVG
jgi:hypothetical protein